jgi:hypothetical protein
MKSNALSQIVFWLSVIAVVMAFVGALGHDLWIASSQWMLVAAVLGIWSVFFKE